MTILDIAREIKQKEKSEVKQKENFSWKPMKAKDYTLPELNFPKITKPNRKKLSKVLAFIDLTKYKRYSEGCTILPIATTDKRLVSICGSQREVSRLLSFMIDMGLIETEINYYQFNATMEKYNMCKIYKYYVDHEKSIVEFCKIHNINKYLVKNNIKSEQHKKITIDNFDNKQVRFSSKLHLLKPDNYSVAEFEEYLIDVLYENYPRLSYYQELADEINEKYYIEYPELSLRFIPNFTWSKDGKAVRKIGIRCTNSLVSAKKSKDGNSSYDGLYKEDILKQYGFNLEKDIKSSIPRLTLSINLGGWIDESIDVYKIIFDKYIAKKEENINCDFESIRESIKLLHMRGYFDTESTIGVHTRRVMANVTDKEAIDEEMKLYKKAIVSAEGGQLFDTEIFYYESCLCIEVLNELFKEGYFVWNVYDAFYAKGKGSQKEFEEHTSRLIEVKANKLIKEIKK